MKIHHLGVYKLALYSLFFSLVLTGCSKPVETTETTTSHSKNLLRDYVQGPAPDFQYEIVLTKQEEGYDFYVLKMISQKWLSPDLVDQNEWWHWVSMIVPKDSPFETGMMWIGGGSTNSAMPTEPDALILEAAKQTNSIVAQIHNVPFQPITFANDEFGERYEDAIIAYGWMKFLEGGAKDEDAIWLARFPMTKAVKLAMDAVTEVALQKNQKDLKKFFVAGASKRGWTTWTTAATDDRVIAIAPVVIDLLNLKPSFQHHWKNYGFWAPAVTDYVREGVMDWMGTPEFDRLLELTEPYSFVDQLDIPKLLINASGDQFFQPDSWEFYWNDLKGEKHVQYVPNFGHDLSKSDAFPNLISFYASILNQSKRPEYHWEIEGDKILIKTTPSNKPVSVKLWSAYNPLSRDFRIDEFGPNWVAEEIPMNESGELEILMKTPEEGFRGYFVELTFVGETPLKVTSGIEVLPRDYPYGEFVPQRAAVASH
ncbi:PhoPQ-activated pathogenicity-related family protein [Algoriphagus sp. CAU 1675]|uniref:PhoPQ-activated pathogenicity-related family protein n=1 Tax=Algoriphagus sp. CAU 1675 TaxID=3032597 RepID=UPI0023DBD2E7|nr:PhoPQ-activated pathogenicity-related family protein [Algoriphagus sp. CAU 1675]MDF2157271.1 PhoPQ-activated pathogenicity-related family protein [Algoriphagus sp. CAU 1675]